MPKCLDYLLFMKHPRNNCAFAIYAGTAIYNR